MGVIIPVWRGGASWENAKATGDDDYETKLAAVRDHVEHGLTKAEVMEKYRIAGPAPLERWCREYRSGGRTRCVRNRRAGPGREIQAEAGSHKGTALRRRTRTSRRGSRT